MDNNEFNKNNEASKDAKDVIELVVDNGKKTSFSIFGIISFVISILLAISLGILYFMMQHELKNVKMIQQNIDLNEKRLLENEAKIAQNHNNYNKLYNENKKQIQLLIASNKELQTQLEALLANQDYVIEEANIQTPIENETENEYYMITKPKVPETSLVNQVIPQIPTQPILPEIYPVGQ